MSTDPERQDSVQETKHAKEQLTMIFSGHTLSPMDPDSPMAWPLWKKMYTSAVAFSFVFVLLYGTTTYASALPFIPQAFGVSDRTALLGFGMPFFGVFFAPLYTPHVVERYGRRPLYFTALPLFSLCVIVIGLAQDFNLLLAFRFFAGLFGGPMAVLIEGTFADIWSAEYTVTYYSFLTLASFSGAAFGPIVGGFVIKSKGAAWLSWVTLVFAMLALAFGSAMPETYGRQILRTRIHYKRLCTKLPAAQSGVTLSQMAHITVFTPLKMLVTEPIIIMITIYLGLNFALVFQWFVSVPFVLNAVYDFDISRSGLAFIGAVGGATMALISATLIERLSSYISVQKGMPAIENRLLVAMVGSFLTVGSLFWIGFTTAPTFSYFSPIFGTAVYVWGNAMGLISLISYLFDAYPPAGTLSGLTVAASFRLACAGIVPIFIKDIIAGITGAWAFGTFGFISLFTLLLPFVLFFFGPSLRARSRYSNGNAGMSCVQVQRMALSQSMRTADVAERQELSV